MNDATLTTQLEDWFSTNARDLPWRLEVRDPYHALVSEIMLQQTQVSRVLEKYQPFIDRFPTARALAQAPEDEVLAMWAGLGYYRRARMLHACAQALVEHHAGIVPSDIQELEALPGIGRYTAGAIASIVFHQRVPIVDGNVTRVLLRVHNKPIPQTDKDTVKWAWTRADELVNASTSPAGFNEAMMELGATCCTPKNIRCEQCPIRSHCLSYEAGTTESIPLPKPRAKQKPMYCASVVACVDDTILLEQRPSKGMWANMYQVPTVDRDDRPSTQSEIATHLGVGVESLHEVSRLTHITTHRVVEFVIWSVETLKSRPDQHYRALKTLDELATSNAQRKVLALAGVL